MTSQVCSMADRTRPSAYSNVWGDSQLCSMAHYRTRSAYILVKVLCECITANIARGCGREPIKHEAQPSALFARDHAPSAIFAVMHERERYFNWFIVAEFLASAVLNYSKWALRSKLPITMLGRSRGKSPCDL